MNGKDIRKFRKKLGLTQKEIAAILGVDQVTVNRWENNKARPSRLALRQLERLSRR